MVRVIVLGSGQDAGVPQLGAPDRRPYRTAASLGVVTDAGMLLLDASPDIRLQHRALVDRLGEVPITAVALTHAHMGHYVGLVHFGKEAAATRNVPLYLTAAMVRFLAGNEPWATLLRGHLLPRIVTPGERAGVLPGVTLVAIPVPHRGELSDTVAYVVEVDGTRILYLPDLDAWEAWPEADRVLADVDVALVDGTFHDGDELTDRRQGAVPHPPMTDTAERFSSLAGRIVFTHLNWTNPAADPTSPQASSLQTAGFAVAEDGMEVLR